MTRERIFLHAFNLLTIVLWGFTVMEFLTKGQVVVGETIANIYVLLLAYYATDKEIRRWHKKYKSRKRPGELIVLGWGLTALLTLLIEISGGAEHGYIVPRQLPLIASSVLIIFVITEYIKTEFRKKK